MTIIINPPADIIKLDTDLAAIKQSIMDYQDDCFQQLGIYKEEKDLSDLWSFESGIAAIQERQDNGKGYFIIMHKISNTITNINGQIPYYDEDGTTFLGWQTINFNTYEWEQEIDFLDPSKSTGWIPVEEEPPEV